MKKIILGITVLLVLLPGLAAAEVVGALMPTRNVPYFMQVHEALVKELQNLGVNAEVVLQKPAPSEMAWKNATRKLVVLGAQVVIAYGSETALAVIGENSDVPVVYTGAYAPVECGIKGKVTGMEASLPIDELIDNLKKISNFTRLGILYSSDEISSVKQMEKVASVAQKTGASVLKIDTHGGDTFDLGNADAVVLTSSATINQNKNLREIVDKSRTRKIATASVLCGTCENGVLMSISANPEHQGKGAAKMVADILKGKKPSDIPPNTSPEIDMTINLREAKDLGFTIPFDMLGKAKVVK